MPLVPARTATRDRHHPVPGAARSVGRALPTPPAFRPAALTRELADRLVEVCPSRRAAPSACAGPGCRRLHGVRTVPWAAPDAVAASGEFELAATGARICQAHPARARASSAMSLERSADAAGRSALERELRPGRGRTARRALPASSAAAFTSAPWTPARARSASQEIRLLAAPHYDLHRLGFFFTPAPRHADLLLVTGPMVRAFDASPHEVLRRHARPEGVVAAGACALGGVYQPDAFMHGSVDELLPVDVWIPGCPPSPLALLQGLLVAVGPARASGSPALSFASSGRPEHDDHRAVRCGRGRLAGGGAVARPLRTAAPG